MSKTVRVLLSKKSMPYMLLACTPVFILAAIISIVVLISFIINQIRVYRENKLTGELAHVRFPGLEEGL